MRVAVDGKIEAAELILRSQRLRKDRPGADLQAATALLSEITTMLESLNTAHANGARVQTVLMRLRAEHYTLDKFVRDLASAQRRAALEAERDELKAEMGSARGAEYNAIIERFREIRSELAGLK